MEDDKPWWLDFNNDWFNNIESDNEEVEIEVLETEPTSNKVKDKGRKCKLAENVEKVTQNET